MRALIFILSTLLLSPSLVTADTLIDRFEAEATNTRLSERGDWKFADGIASCVSDPELYKKFSNHGPILKWPNQFKNATIECEIKAEDCGRVVFTINGDGHIFRITLADERDEAPAGKSKVPTRLIAWAEKSSKQNKGDTLIPSGMPDLPSINGRWIPLRFEIREEDGYITIGDFKTKISHPALQRAKNTVMLTFAHGKLSVKNFKMTYVQ